MKYNKIICWVSKRHEKLMKKAFPDNTIFVNSIDEIDQKENDTIVISLAKITSIKIAEKIKQLRDPYFLEINGSWTYNMMVGMEDSKHNIMIANSWINSSLFDDDNF
jgi:hypothetical protein